MHTVAPGASSTDGAVFTPPHTQSGEGQGTTQNINFCSSCGYRLGGDATNFCSNCGAGIKKTAFNDVALPEVGPEPDIQQPTPKTAHPPTSSFLSAAAVKTATQPRNPAAPAIIDLYSNDTRLNNHRNLDPQRRPVATSPSAQMPGGTLRPMPRIEFRANSARAGDTNPTPAAPATIDLYSNDARLNNHRNLVLSEAPVSRIDFLRANDIKAGGPKPIGNGGSINGTNYPAGAQHAGNIISRGPPGSLEDGYWSTETYWGPVTWLVFCFLFWPVACCPVDSRQVYTAPDGGQWPGTTTTKVSSGLVVGIVVYVGAGCALSLHFAGLY